MPSKKKQETPHTQSSKKETESQSNETLIHKHMTIGWLGLLIFLSLGIVLEIMHGFKINWYLDVRNETRRLMWTLAHTHGTLFSLIHIGLAVTLYTFNFDVNKNLRLASTCLTGALVLMPLGFFLGGIWLYAGDPGLGVFLVPIGGILLLLSVAIIFQSVRKAKSTQ